MRLYLLIIPILVLCLTCKAVYGKSNIVPNKGHIDVLCIAGYANRIRHLIDCENVKNIYLSTTSYASPMSRGGGNVDYDIHSSPGYYEKRMYTDEEVKNLWRERLNYKELQNISNITQHLDKNRRAKKRIIFFSNHGGAPDGLIKNEITGSISIYGKITDIDKIRATSTISMKDSTESIPISKLATTFSSHIDSENELVLIGSQCYNGSLHDVTFQRNKTCSASGTDWLTKYIVYSDGKERYSAGLLSEVGKTFNSKEFDFDTDNKTDLIEGHIAGVLHDSINFGRGTLSSMAFVDKMLNLGVYSNNFFLMSDDTTPLGKPMICAAPSYLVAMTRNIPILNKIIRDTTLEARKIGTFNSKDHTLTDEEIDVLPKKLRIVYHKLLTNKIFLNAIDQVFDKVPKMRKEILSLKKKLNKIYQKDIKQTDDYDEIKSLEDNVRKKINAMNEAKAPLRGVLRFLEYLKKIKVFLNKYNPLSEERKKFFDILGCEFGEL